MVHKKCQRNHSVKIVCTYEYFFRVILLIPTPENKIDLFENSVRNHSLTLSKTTRNFYFPPKY